MDSKNELKMYPFHLFNFETIRYKTLTVDSDIEIPFPTKRLAEIAYHVLRVDTEPKRSGVKKEISFDDNILKVQFSAQLARQLRVAINGFFENINLIAETIEFVGEPVSSEYSHF
jgi:tRNA threonylcarbamoyladenosine modification (KEOPS) complex  Pcc1 subunit